MKRTMAAAGLALLVLGVPAFLLRLYGAPWVPDINLQAAGQILSGPLLSADSILRFIGLLTWVLWAYLALLVTLRAAALTILRRNPGTCSKIMSLTSRVTPSALMKVVDFAVGGALLLVPIAPKAAGAALATSLPPAVAQHEIGELQVPSAAADTTGGIRARYYLVRPGESLWEIAAHRLGTGHRWKEIFELNKGRLFPDGGVLDDPRLIRPEWILWLPPDQREAMSADAPLPATRGATDAGPARRVPAERAIPSDRPSSAAPNRALTENAGGRKDSDPIKGGEVRAKGDQQEVRSGQEARAPVVRLPSGASLTASFAAGILASHAAAALHRRRRFRPASDNIEHEAQSAILGDLRAAGAAACAGDLEAGAAQVAEAWRASLPGWPRLLAALESQTGAVFMLEGPAGDEVLPQSTSRVSFELTREVIRAEVRKPFAGWRPDPCLGTFAPLGIAEGGLVVHINLSACGPVSIEGEDADRLVENWLVHCANSRSPQELELFVLGYLADSAWAELPHLRSLNSWSDAHAALHQLEVEILGRARLLAEQAVPGLVAESGEFVPTLVVVASHPPPELIADLESFASQAAGVGIGFLAVGWTPPGGLLRVTIGSKVEIKSDLPVPESLVPSLLEAAGIREAVELVKAANPTDGEPAARAGPESREPSHPGGSPMAAGSDSPSEYPLDLEATKAASINGKVRLQSVGGGEAEGTGDADAAKATDTFEREPQKENRLEVRCLGTMSVSRGGTPIGTGWFKRSKELLAYLVANREGVPRDRLLDVLFPEVEPKQAERLLRDAIYYVRRQALAEGEATWSEAYLSRVGHNIVLGQEGWWADAWEFEALIARAGRLEGAEAGPLLRRAVELYRGDFCDDAYFSWLEPVRERYRRVLLKAAARLAELLSCGGDTQGAIEALERATEVDPYCEDLYRRLIELEAREGRVNAAEQRYQKLARLLAEELGVEPEPKTMELMSSLTRSRRSVQIR